MWNLRVWNDSEILDLEIYFYLIALRNKFKDLKNKQPQCKHKRFLHQFLYFFSIKRNAQISKAITYKWPYNSNSFFFCSCLKVFRKFCCVMYTLYLEHLQLRCIQQQKKSSQCSSSTFKWKCSATNYISGQLLVTAPGKLLYLHTIKKRNKSFA